MKVYRTLDEFQKIKNAVVTLGTYDGVHVGHQKIIKRLKEIAARENGETVILTFFPHPRTVLYPDDNELKQINTIAEKITLLEKNGIEHLIIQPFTKKFSRFTAIEFVRDVLVNKLNTKKLVIGYNHQFGRNREGNFAQLVELSSLYGFSVEKISEQDVNHIAVSSTKIREALKRGDIKTADEFLGYDFYMTGKVVHGDKFGQSLGFPTANLNIEEKYKIIPSEGIYAVLISINNRCYDGMLYIGYRPTFEGNKKNTEVHIFDFSDNIYNEYVTVHFKERIRNDIKFSNTEELRQQLHKDKATALNILRF